MKMSYEGNVTIAINILSTFISIDDQESGLMFDDPLYFLPLLLLGLSLYCHTGRAGPHLKLMTYIYGNAITLDRKRSTGDSVQFQQYAITTLLPCYRRRRMLWAEDLNLKATLFR